MTRLELETRRGGRDLLRACRDVSRQPRSSVQPDYTRKNSDVQQAQLYEYTSAVRGAARPPGGNNSAPYQKVSPQLYSYASILGGVKKTIPSPLLCRRGRTDTTRLSFSLQPRASHAAFLGRSSQNWLPNGYLDICPGAVGASGLRLLRREHG